jgi:predicted DNA-binding protein YlxM (UPF0122 family)
MTYDEIGAEIGITKQAVSQNVKKGVNKIFNYIHENIAKSPFEALSMLVIFLNIDNHDDFKQMYKLIDTKYKKSIERSKEWITRSL